MENEQALTLTATITAIAPVAGRDPQDAVEALTRTLTAAIYGGDEPFPGESIKVELTDVSEASDELQAAFTALDEKSAQEFVELLFGGAEPVHADGF